MRFAMIFEGIDRATKVMNKIMAAEKATASASAANSKKATAATEAATAATTKQTNAASRASSAFRAMGAAARGAYAGVGAAARSGYNAVIAGANAAIRATAALHRKTVTLGKNGFGQMMTGGQKAFRGVELAATLGVAGATTAFAVSAAAATGLVGVASQFEKFQTILETTEGSSAKAKTAMNWVADFAAKTPYELSEVTDSFVKMRSYGLDPTKGLLQSMGDTSAAMGKPLTQAVEAMADAVTGENERLKEFGVTASKTGNKITYAYTNAAGKQMTASVKASDRMAIQTKLMAIFNEKYGGAMEKLSGTWEGMMSNIADIWSQFQLAIMNAGLFDWMKGKLKLVLDTLNQMKADGTFDEWAKRISDNIIAVLDGAWQFGKGVWAVMKQLGIYLKSASDYVGGWENLAAILAGLAFAPVLISTAAGLVQIAIGLSMLSAALMANPIVLIIAAIVAAAALIYIYWEPIKAFFLDLWNSIVQFTQKAYNKFVEITGFDPLGFIARAWTAVKTFFVALWNAIPGIAAKAWEVIKAILAWTPLGLIVGNWGAIKAFFIDLWNSVVEFTQKAYAKFVEVTGFDPLGAISRAWTAVKTFFIDLWNAIPSLASKAWAAIKATLAWTPLGLIVENWSTIKDAASKALETAFDSVSTIWDRIKKLMDWSPIEAIKAAWAGIADAVGGFIDDAAARASAAWSKVKSVFTFGDTKADVNVTDPATIQAVAAATAGLKADMQAVAAIDTGPAMEKLQALDKAAKAILPAITTAVQQARTFLSGVSFYNQGASLMDTMAAGIRARSAAAVAEIAKVAQMMRDHLPSSPAKVGPLSDIHRLKFGETIAESIRPQPMVKAMRAAALATMGAAAITAPAVAGPDVTPALAPANTAANQTQADAARAQIASVALQSNPQAANGGGSPIALHFNPTIKWDGQTPPANIKAEFDKLMRDNARQFADLMEEEQRRRNRRNV
ncbi:hypothetical protein H4S14_004164 [Agrobacterium vitis]|nr:hypothetical protein [Agrobacterium vitis]MBE1440390.1 hypothetical protein [Agrobacterium vitis]